MEEREFVETLKGISPLDLPNYLKDCEFYNRQSGEDLIREIDEKYTGKNGIIHSLVAPAFVNILGNVSRELNVKPIKKMMKMGVTPDRLISELYNFNYDNDFSVDNVSENDLQNIHNAHTRKYNRKMYEDTTALKKYKRKHFKNKNNEKVKMAEDEYTGKLIYEKEADADKRNYSKKTKHFSHVDHIVPLKDKFDEISNIPALKDEDIKRILNMEENYAVTNANLNSSKKDKSNKEYTDMNTELDEKTKDIMMKKHKTANAAMNKEIGKTVIKNVGADSMDEAVGDVIMLGIKASFFEVTDSIKNGITHKTNLTTKIAAFSYRIKRVVKFVLFKLKEIVSSNIFEFLKSIFINIASMLIGMITGIFKNIAKIIVNGFTAIVQAVKIMMAPAEEMTFAQKADAVVKLVASTAVLFIGDVTKTLLTRVGVPEKFVSIANAFLLGFVTAFIGYALDKIDIFGAKIDVRRQRINEIFNARIDEINNNAKDFRDNTLIILERQMKDFKGLQSNILKYINEDNHQAVLETSFEIAEFFDVDLEYNNTKEFVDYIDNNGLVF